MGSKEPGNNHQKGRQHIENDTRVKSKTNESSSKSNNLQSASLTLPITESSDSKFERIQKWRLEGAMSLGKAEEIYNFDKESSQHKHKDKSRDRDAQTNTSYDRFKHKKKTSKEDRLGLNSSASRRGINSIRYTDSALDELNSKSRHHHHQQSRHHHRGRRHSDLDKNKRGRSRSPKSMKKLVLKCDYRTLKISNLPLNVTLNDLKSLFSTAKSITIPLDVPESSKTQIAMVKFNSKSDAEDILLRFQGFKIKGNPIEITVELQHSLAE